MLQLDVILKGKGKVLEECEDDRLCKDDPCRNDDPSDESKVQIHELRDEPGLVSQTPQ